MGMPMCSQCLRFKGLVLHEKTLTFSVLRSRKKAVKASCPREMMSDIVLWLIAPKSGWGHLLMSRSSHSLVVKC